MLRNIAVNNLRQITIQTTVLFTNRIRSRVPPLDEVEMTRLLKQQWLPAGVTLPYEALATDVIASLIRLSGGNFCLLTRLLT